MMVRSYKYRIYPTETQQRRLFAMLRLSRLLYNHMLGYAIWQWSRSRRSVSAFDMIVLAKDWRNEDEELALLPTDIIAQTVCRRLDKAYKAFFGRVQKGIKPAGFPKFKSARFWNSLAGQYTRVYRIDGRRLRMTRVGRIPVRWDRPVPEDAKIKHVVVSYKNGKWYAVFQCELPDAKLEPVARPVVGIDVGIYHALALSDGTIYDAPKPLAEAQRRLRVLQRKLARQKRGSNRRKETVRLIARLHEHIANIRRDWWFKVVHELTEKYGGFVLEDLTLGFMTKNRRLARVAHDVAIGTFWQILDQKAGELGLPVVRVRAAWTSQTCPNCGAVQPKTLSERVHSCECGCVMDRDVAAAIVILRRGIEGGTLPANAKPCKTPQLRGAVVSSQISANPEREGVRYRAFDTKKRGDVVATAEPRSRRVLDTGAP